MDNLNIGMMTDTYIPQVNGVATSVHLFKRYLENMGEKVYVFAPMVPQDEDNVFKVSGLKFFWEKQHRLAIPISHKISNLTSRLGIDIIHSHAPFSMGFQALRISEKLGIPHVHTYHTLLTEYRHYIPLPFRPTEEAVKEFSAWFCNLTDTVIAPTDKIKEELVGYGVTVPIHVLPTGIDVENFQKPLTFSVKKKHSIPENNKIILYAGRIAKEKNVDFLLESFALLHASFKNVTLIMAGNGPEMQEMLHRAHRLGIFENVVMTGYVNRDVLVEYYRQADVFAFASVTETQGLVVLEALAAGLPVVAVGKEGVKDVLRNGVGCILLDDVELLSFTKAVEKFLRDDKFSQKMSEEGVKYVTEHWSMNTMAKKIDEIYKNVLSSSNRRRKEDGSKSFFTYLRRLGLRVF
jgi:1,2-diacylglycerol 3-alpha-glucosyltransferase